MSSEKVHVFDRCELGVGAFVWQLKVEAGTKEWSPCHALPRLLILFVAFFLKNRKWIICHVLAMECQDIALFTKHCIYIKKRFCFYIDSTLTLLSKRRFHFWWKYFLSIHMFKDIAFLKWNCTDLTYVYRRSISNRKMRCNRRPVVSI
jgi:hypothetical protein